MSKPFKIFLIAFVVSMPFWWGFNVFSQKIEDFFFWYKIATDPQLLVAQASQERFEQQLNNLKPFRNHQVGDLEIEAKSVLAVHLTTERQKVLLGKNKEAKLPIASLTKLMTALIVLENYPFNQEIENLLYSLLMESSNDAAYALTETMGEEAFVDLMNLTAKDLGLENTYFVNPTGLDPHTSGGVGADPQEDALPHHSTAEDLVKFTNYLLKKPLIWEILSTYEFDLYSPNGLFDHKVLNTNELLGQIPSIVGGKTGETPKAGDCLLLVLKAPRNNGYLINVILGSQDRFKEMKKLIGWVRRAYKW